MISPKYNDRSKRKTRVKDITRVKGENTCVSYFLMKQ